MWLFQHDCYVGTKPVYHTPGHLVGFCAAYSTRGLSIPERGILLKKANSLKHVRYEIRNYFFLAPSNSLIKHSLKIDAPKVPFPILKILSK